MFFPKSTHLSNSPSTIGPFIPFTLTDNPAPETSEPEYPQPVDNTMTIIGVGAAILAAIAIVGIVVVLMLRKRP